MHELCLEILEKDALVSMLCLAFSSIGLEASTVVICLLLLSVVSPLCVPFSVAAAAVVVAGGVVLFVSVGADFSLGAKIFLPRKKATDSAETRTGKR